MLKDSSAKYYQKRKKGHKTGLVEGIKIFLKKKPKKKKQEYGCKRYRNLPEHEKKKRENMVGNHIKFSSR